MTKYNNMFHVGDQAWRDRETHKQRREWLWQGVVVIVVIAVLALFAYNVTTNLEARNIRSGFAFLGDRSSFEIGEALIDVSSNDGFGWMFLAGMLNTIRVAIVSILTATLLGVVVGLMRLSRHPLIRFLGAAHVEFYRNIPLLIQLFAIYLVITEFLPDIFTPLEFGSWALLSKAGFQFAVPEALGWANLIALALGTVAAFAIRAHLLKKITSLMSNVFGCMGGVGIAVVVWCAFGVIGGWSKPVLEGFMVEGGASATPEFLTLWLGLTLFTSASIAEIVRAGVLAVPQGQWRAAEALGMTRMQAVSYVVLPQSLRLAIPPMASQYMNLTKNSSLAVIIGYPDIVSVGNTSIVIMGQALEAILIIMCVYLLLNLIIAVVMNRLNARVVAAPK
jgi:general L-amino acid transport system permease protein